MAMIDIDDPDLWAYRKHVLETAPMTRDVREVVSTLERMSKIILRGAPLKSPEKSPT